MEEGKGITKLMTVEELASFAKLSPATIYRQWRDLKGFKIGGSIRFDWELTRDCLLNSTEEGEAVVMPLSKTGRVSSRGGFPKVGGSQKKIYLPASKNGLW